MRQRLKVLFIKKHIILVICCLFTIFSKGDTVIQQRLASLKSNIPLTYNDATQYYIDWYINNPDSTAKTLTFWKVYSPIMDKVLKENGQPIELKYLAFALSNMNNQLVTKGSSGVWQMMFDDAKTKYKLKINSLIDERRDIEKCTKAIASYFKDLMLLYNDWYMSMTAYKATPTSLNKSIINAGINMNYWSIYPFLSYENREIVPRFVAAAYIVNFYGSHNISVPDYEYIYDYDTVKAEQQMSFQSISAALNIPIEQLQFLNPEYKTGVIPYATKNYILRLPKGLSSKFEEKKYSIFSSFVPPAPVITKENVVVKKDSAKTTESEKFVKVAYKVKSGESLVIVSDYFDCTVKMTKVWNSIPAKTLYINPGKTLYFMVPTEKKAYYESFNYMALKQKKKLAKRD